MKSVQQVVQVRRGYNSRAVKYLERFVLAAVLIAVIFAMVYYQQPASVPLTVLLELYAAVLIGIGAIIGWLVRLEQELGVQQARFNAFFSSANAGLVIVDDQLRHVHLNQPLAEINGLPIAAHIGKTLQEILPDIAVAVEPIYRRVIATGKPMLNREVSGATRKDPDVVRHWFNSYFPLFDQAGKTIGAGAVIIDITDRKQAEKALRQKAQQEQLLNQLANQIRSSLDFDEILKTALRSIRDLLGADRCSFSRYYSDTSTPYWMTIQEANNSVLPSLLGFQVLNKDIMPLSEKAFNKEINRLEDSQALSDSRLRQFYQLLGYRAEIVLPIHNQAGIVGVVCCVQAAARVWQDEEVSLVQAVADQLAIALNQADLYKESRLAAETAQAQAQQLEQTLQELRHTQAQLVQTEKMSSLGQLVAGVAHEINNPVNFIHGNLTYLEQYTEDLLRLMALYQQFYPNPCSQIQAEAAALDLDFLLKDLPKLLGSMKVGTDRIREIVLALRNFSRIDEAEMKTVDIHTGIDSTLMILQSRLKDNADSGIEVIKDYGDLPPIECYAGQLNQVFMNILANAIDALNESEIIKHSSQITIQTKLVEQRVCIWIRDNGSGMTEQTRQRLFEPFFTTKPVGKGTGLGLSISYQVIDRHRGKLSCISAPGEGATFLIELPLSQSSAVATTDAIA